MVYGTSDRRFRVLVLHEQSITECFRLFDYYCRLYAVRYRIFDLSDSFVRRICDYRFLWTFNVTAMPLFVTRNLVSQALIWKQYTG